MIDIFDPIKNMWQAAATNLYILTNNLRGNLMFHFSSTPTGTTCSQPINYPAAGEYFNEFSDILEVEK